MSSKAHSEPVTTVDFRDLIDWYQHHCDGSWEHRYGLKLETLDNPGWLLTVDLAGTDLHGLAMREIREGIAPENHPVSPAWIHCTVRDNQFRGACDAAQAARLFQIFSHFRYSHTPSNSGKRALD